MISKDGQSFASSEAPQYWSVLSYSSVCAFVVHGERTREIAMRCHKMIPFEIKLLLQIVTFQVITIIIMAHIQKPKSIPFTQDDGYQIIIIISCNYHMKISLQ